MPRLALVALGAMLAPTNLFFAVLALVLGKRPLRTGSRFYVGALTMTMIVEFVRLASLFAGNQPDLDQVQRTDEGVVDAKPSGARDRVA